VIAVIVGVEFTVIVKANAGPVTPFAVGVTVIVATTGEAPAFVAVKLAMFPEPLAARPIEVVLFVQLNVVPDTAPLNVTAVVAAPLATVWFETAATVGVGFTVTVNGTAAPVTPAAVGVTEKLAVTGEAPVFVAVKLEMAVPEPLAPMPMVVLSLVHV
jgi:hypothetical protein